MSESPAVLRLYDTLTRSLVPLVPGDPSRVTFYTCGPTVYDDCHIGNFRSFLAADLLRRWIESPLCTLQAPDGSTHTGPRTVVHVMNITDVGHMTDDAAADGGGEDKMATAGQRILEAKKSGKLPEDADVDPGDPQAIGVFFTDRFVEDAKALGLKVITDAEANPELMPRASAYVEPGMIPMIESLIDKGHAYVAGDAGSQAVYFDVQSYPTYGALSGNTLDQLRGGAGGRVSDANQSQKKHPADFLLWKEDESHLMKWRSPWGTGYPGWHIECSAMSRALLGDVIDLHSGGEDNIFPHHECERAQSCCATGHDTFARHWFHGRFLMVEGKKMSKSAGTFYTARQLFEQGHDPAAVRLELVKTHYRSNADFSMDSLRESAITIERWRNFGKHLRLFREHPSLAASDESRFAELADDLVEVIVDALSSDLNVAGFIAGIHVIMRDAAAYKSEAAIEKAKELRSLSESTGDWFREVLTPDFAPDPSTNPGMAKLWSALAEAHRILGVLPIAKSGTETVSRGIAIFEGIDPNPEVEALLAERAEAKKAKDYARSDAIRDELAGKGYAIKDVAGGKVEVGPA